MRGACSWATGRECQILLGPMGKHDLIEDFGRKIGGVHWPALDCREWKLTLRGETQLTSSGRRPSTFNVRKTRPVQFSIMVRRGGLQFSKRQKDPVIQSKFQSFLLGSQTPLAISLFFSFFSPSTLQEVKKDWEVDLHCGGGN